MSAIKKHWFALLFIAASLIRLPRPAPWWYDEAFTAWLTRLPFERMITATAGDVHPPLFYLLEWLVARVPGATDTALRLLPAVFSLMALYAAKRIAEELRLSTAAQVVGLSIMAVSGWQLYYAQEVRSYSLSLLLFCLGVWSGMGQRWAWLFVAFTGLLYTHNTNLIMCLVIGIWALAHEMRRPVESHDDPVGGFVGTAKCTQWHMPILAGLGALGLWAPWFVAATIPQLREFTDHWIWVPAPADVLVTFTGFLFTQPDSYVFFVWFLIVGIALTVFVFWRVFSAREHLGLAFLALAPLVLAVVLSYVWTPLYLARSLIGASVPFYLLIGWALTDGVPPVRRAWAAALLIPLVAIGSPAADRARGLAYNRFYPEAVVSRITADWQPGDVVYSLNLYGLIELEQWLGDRTGYLYPIEGAGLHGGGLTLLSRQAMGITDFEKPLSAIEWRRAWLVVIDGPGLHQTPERDSLLSAYPHQLVFRLADKREANSVEVYLLWPATLAH